MDRVRVALGFLRVVCWRGMRAGLRLARWEAGGEGDVLARTGKRRRRDAKGRSIGSEPAESFAVGGGGRGARRCTRHRLVEQWGRGHLRKKRASARRRGTARYDVIKSLFGARVGAEERVRGVREGAMGRGGRIGGGGGGGGGEQRRDRNRNSIERSIWTRDVVGDASAG